MADSRQNINMPAKNHSSKKPLVVAVSVICTLSVMIIAFLIFKNPLYFSIAKSKTENGNYSSALELCKNSTSDKTVALTEYLELRLDINQNYPQLLSEFDIAKINGWIEKSSAVTKNAEILGETISAQATELLQTLTLISEIHSRYVALRPEVLSAMDVFAEFNTLYSVDSSQNNTAFTVNSVLSKISAWERYNADISAFALTIPGYESIYLLNYLTKEIHSECIDLRSAMDEVIAMGFAPTDTVRLGGTAQKKFPAIQNSNGETVSVNEKGRYESFMYAGICRRLTEILGKFYTP